jgi:ribose transport system ATP-binding protein
VNPALSDARDLLEARSICKSFPGVQALQDVNLRLQQGEVLAVVGENGAGKSTLMNILGGVLTPDAGTIHLNREVMRIGSVEEAERRGIVLIHQELNLAEHLDIAGNVFLGREPHWGGPLRLIRRRIYDDAEQITRRLGLACSPRVPVAQLSPGQQQLVEIARALSLRSRILILDEPTSSLTDRETECLFQVLRDLKGNGISIVYISHRLKEVQAIADRVTILRDGRNAGDLAGDEIRHDTMVRLMVGRELKQFFQRSRSFVPGGRKDRPPVLEARGVRLAGRHTAPMDFTISAGEILGLAGLMGAGRTELAEALFGISPPAAGELHMDGRPVRIRNPMEAIAAGIILVPEDRRWQGLVLSASVRENISLPSLKRLSRVGLVSRRSERALAASQCRRLNVRTPSIEQTTALLSGGNQQKVVLAKWLCRTPRLLILDEPTRGIDVGAKTEIYALMDQLASQGLGVLMISSDLEEVLGMSDRVLVMHEGRLAGVLSRGEMTEEAIMHLATGG